MYQVSDVVISLAFGIGKIVEIAELQQNSGLFYLIEGIEEKFKTFHPDPLKFKSIEVTSRLPLTLWGEPLPNIRNSTFSLPWFTTNDRKTKR